LILSLQCIVKNRKVLIGIIILSIFLLMALIGAFIPMDLLSTNTSEIYQGPSLKHPLGTDYAGRDIFLQLIKGSTDVLIVAFLTALITTSIATVVGIVSGYVGGYLDLMLMTLVNIILTIPHFPLLIVIASLIRTVPNPLIVAGILSSVAWAGPARAIRSQVLSIKEEEYIEAAKILGLRRTQILFNEILPVIIPYVIMNFILATVSAIYSQVGMYFLGVLPFTSYNWGMMMNIARSHSGALWIPSTTLYLIAPMLCVVLLCEGLTMLLPLVEMLNPRLREE